MSTLPSKKQQIESLFELTHMAINSIIAQLGITQQDSSNKNFSEEYIHRLIEGKDIAISKGLLTLPSQQLT